MELVERYFFLYLYFDSLMVFHNINMYENIWNINTYPQYISRIPAVLFIYVLVKGIAGHKRDNM